MVETVELDSDESNELTFKINVEGRISGPARVNLVCEGNDVSYMFLGEPTGEDGNIRFKIPKSVNLKEGTYPSHIDVLIDNKRFVPSKFNIEFKKSIEVFAEAVSVSQRKKSQDQVSVSAMPVSVKTANSEQRPLTLADRYKQRKVVQR